MRSFYASVASALLCIVPTHAALPDDIELLWEAMPSGNYCTALPPVKKNATASFPRISINDGLVCQQWIGPAVAFSPDEYGEVVQGKIISPIPDPDLCPVDAKDGYTCSGGVTLNLGAAKTIQQIWTAGIEVDSNFELQPPIGPMQVVSTFTSPLCTGADTAKILCEAVDLPTDWGPSDDQSIYMIIGTGRITLSMALFTYRGGVTVRINKFGIKCPLPDAGTMPAGCGAEQVWSYELRNRITADNADTLHAQMLQQEGLTINHPFDKPGVTVQKGLPVASDPCNDHKGRFECARDGVPTLGPCFWNGTLCYMDMPPVITPENTTLGIDDATYTFKFDGWGFGFETVRAFYWTFGDNETDTPIPKVPDKTSSEPQARTCRVPCELSWSAPGNYTLRVVAHVEASIAGRFRDVFYSAVATKNIEVVPNPVPTAAPTQVPTPGPTVSATAQPSVAPNPMTEVPPTPPPSPAPTKAPRAAQPTLAPPVTDTPAPTFADPCESFAQNACVSPCAWGTNAKCGFSAEGPILKTDASLDPGETVRVEYAPVWCDAAANCTLLELRYQWCTQENFSDCSVGSDPTKWVNASAQPMPLPTMWGIAVELLNCATTECGNLYVRAAALLTTNIAGVQVTEFSNPSSSFVIVNVPDVPLEDPCRGFTEALCAAPCLWTGSCTFRPGETRIKSDKQKACEQQNAATSCILDIGEKVPIYYPETQCNVPGCVVKSTHYQWCDFENRTACADRTYANWQRTPTPSDPSWGVEIHLTHCTEETVCGMISISATTLVSYTANGVTVEQYTTPATAAVYLHSEQATATTEESDDGSSTNVGLLVGLILAILAVLGIGGFVAMKLAQKKRRVCTQITHHHKQKSHTRLYPASPRALQIPTLLCLQHNTT